jgi:hypothetical protein
VTIERDPALDTPGRRLDQFLTRAIAELKPVDEFTPTHPESVAIQAPAKPMVNKFTELAEKLKAVHKAANDEADKLSAEADEIMPLLLDAASKHRGGLQKQKAGIQELRDAANVLSNFDPNA